MTPEWAQLLVEQVCRDEGMERTPTIRWNQAKRRGFMDQIRYYTTGKAYSHEQKLRHTGWEILISAGLSVDDQRIVLLHEMAHWLLPAAYHHNSTFWDKAFYLYHKYGVDGNKAISSERIYRKKAVSAFNRSAYVQQQGLQPEYKWKRTHTQCDCLCHLQKVKA